MMNPEEMTTEEKGKRPSELLFQQKRMSAGAFVGWLIVISTVQWMSLDIYLPAMPQIRDLFGVSEAELNFTLSIYIIFSAVGTVVGGPLSDKYGRKGPTLIGMGMFAVFNLLSAFSQSLMFLVVMRSLAAFGSGVVCTVALAMLKDSLAGYRFQRAMTFLQSLAIIGPILAPVIGAVIISWLTWRDIFIFLAVASALSAIPLLLMEETLIPDKRVVGSIWKATCGLFTVVRDKAFTLFLLIIALISSSWYSYMAVCSYIYLEDFHLSYFMYCVYYGGGAAVSFIAPFCYLYLSRKLRSRTIINICLAMVFCSGLLILLLAQKAALLFFLILLLFLLAEGMSRPLGVVILLQQKEEAVGAASAVTNFALSMVGVAGTAVATLHWGSYLSGLGIILMATILLSAAVWIPLVRSRIRVNGL